MNARDKLLIMLPSLEANQAATTGEKVDLILMEVGMAKLMIENEHFAEALERIVQWSDAYPLEIFPEPDFKRAAELLQAGGMTLDAISASNMRHVVVGVGKIAREALLSRP